MRKKQTSSPELSTKLKLVFGLGFVMVLGVIFVIFLDFRNVRSQSSLSNPIFSIFLPLVSPADQIAPPEGTELENSPLISVVDLGNGWKRLTHRSEKYSFEYPNNWYIVAIAPDEATVASRPPGPLLGAEEDALIFTTITKSAQHAPDLFMTPVGNMWNNNIVVNYHSVSGQQAVELQETEFFETASLITHELVIRIDDDQSLSVSLVLTDQYVEKYQPVWDHLLNSIQVMD